MMLWVLFIMRKSTYISLELTVCKFGMKKKLLQSFSHCSSYDHHDLQSSNDYKIYLFFILRLLFQNCRTCNTSLERCFFEDWNMCSILMDYVISNGELNWREFYAFSKRNQWMCIFNNPQFTKERYEFQYVFFVNILLDFPMPYNLDDVEDVNILNIRWRTRVVSTPWKGWSSSTSNAATLRHAKEVLRTYTLFTPASSGDRSSSEEEEQQQSKWTE